jgi:hypothetical protein
MVCSMFVLFILFQLPYGNAGTSLPVPLWGLIYLKPCLGPRINLRYHYPLHSSMYIHMMSPGLCGQSAFARRFVFGSMRSLPIDIASCEMRSSSIMQSEVGYPIYYR